MRKPWFKHLTVEKMISIELPLSKSQLNRGLIVLAAQGNLKNWLSENPDITPKGCRDTRLLIEALLKHIEGEDAADFMDAGTPYRLFTAFAAAQFKRPMTLSGNRSLKSRKISPLVEALTAMGAKITYPEIQGYPPIFIETGIQQWTDVQISISVSSQFASSLLLIAPLFPDAKRITLTEISHSQSYVDLTIQLLQSLGIDVISTYGREGREISIHGSYDKMNVVGRDQLALEADWSAAAFFFPLLLGLKKTDTLLLEGLSLNSPQGDRQLATLGQLLDIESTAHPSGVVIKRVVDLQDWQQNLGDEIPLIDLQNNPDLVPALVVGWCILGQSIMIQGIENLRYKECDRIAALQQNLAGLGCTLEQWSDGDADLWHLNAAHRQFPAALHIDTKEDHRMAMAFSALQPWINTLTFSDTRCVEKSFPNYWEQWKKCTFE